MTDMISPNASSTLSGGEGAQVNVLLDGKVIGSTIVGTAAATYSFSTTLTANDAHDIQIQYTNDTTSNGQDRNLKLNSIGINGQTVSATSSYEVYHANGQGDINSSGTMNWGGNAEFKLPASYFSGSSAPSTTGFYVSTLGSDSADGSSAHPFATLSRAVTAMAQSGSINTTYVAGGKYYLGSTLNLNSSDSGMTIESAPGSQAVLDGKTSLSTLIQLSGGNNVTLQGLTFENNGSNSAALVLSGAGGNHINGNLFSNTHE